MPEILGKEQLMLAADQYPGNTSLSNARKQNFWKKLVFTNFQTEWHLAKQSRVKTVPIQREQHLKVQVGYHEDTDRKPFYVHYIYM